MNNHYVLTCYTRKPLDADVYSEKLAYSLHLALKQQNHVFQPLNDDSGILFAHAFQRENGSLYAKSLKNPILFKGENNYGVLIKQIEANGQVDLSTSGEVLVYETSNFVDYTKLAVVKLSESTDIEVLQCQYEGENYVIYWKTSEGEYKITTLNLSFVVIKTIDSHCPTSASHHIWQRDDITQGNSLEIDEHTAIYLIKKLTAIAHIDTVIPLRHELRHSSELEAVQAQLLYSDGSFANRPVDWNLDSIDWNITAEQTIVGKVRSSYFNFPVAINRADPHVFWYKDNYYFIATDDTTDGNLNLYIRMAKEIANIAYAEEHLILHHNRYPEIRKFLWAPELHLIGNQLFILFASSDDEFGQIKCHMMRLKDDGNALLASDWERPVVVTLQSGKPLFQDGITLDMTYINVNDQHYVIWAQRQLVPHDTGSWLYIAKISPEKPWQLTSDPVLISQPEFGWANNQTFVDEGPYAIYTKDKLFVTFSSALVNATYCVGLLSIDINADLLNPKNWLKRPYPILTSRSILGEFGPGHNSYTADSDGFLLNVYHARNAMDGPRCSGIRPIHFGFDGEPILKLSEQQFINDKLANVTMKIKLSQ